MSKFLENYKSDMLAVLKRQFPDTEETILKDVLESMIKERLDIPKGVIYDDYRNKEYSVDLLQFVDWTMGKKKPILTGYGVAYRQHSESTNLTAMMLDYLLSERRRAKKEMFQYVNAEDEEGQRMFKLLDTEQKILKLLANSYYGVMGEKNSFFYNQNTGASVTYTGVQIITTAVMAFEKFLYNNLPFNKAGDVLVFIERVLSRINKDNPDFDTELVPSKEELVEYLVKKIRPENVTPAGEQMIRKAVSSLGTVERGYIYFKNNLIPFLENSLPKEILGRIVANSADDFKNAPQEDLEALWNLLEEYVMWTDIPEDRYQRALNDYRKAVLVVDTDSNFLNIDPLYKTIVQMYDLDEEDQNSKIFVINLIIHLLGRYIQKALDQLTSNLNVPEEKQSIIKMESEFLYSRLMLTSNKKQYVGALIAQEGHLLENPRSDMKGMSLKKVSVNARTRDYFTDLIDQDILGLVKEGDKFIGVENRPIDISKILRRFQEFEELVRNSILQGEIDFSVPANLNEIESYMYPYRIPAVRGALAWNALYPDDPLVPPDKVNTFKIKGAELADLEPIYDTEWFEIIREKIFSDEELGRYGFTIISMPKHINKIPEWLLPIINVDEIVSDNVRNGIIILESLGVKVLEILGSSYYSNIIEF